MKTKDKVFDSAHETYDKIANAANEATEALGEKGVKLKKAEQKLMKNCRGYVSNNPITSLGLAAAAGFLLSRLLSRS
jgi:ElaB/YqjD/DUF883 family membrane-anchored ribosome-binding protein